MSVRRSTVNSHIRSHCQSLREVKSCMLEVKVNSQPLTSKSTLISQSQYLREVNCVCKKVNSQQSHQKSQSIFEGGQSQ